MIEKQAHEFLDKIFTHLNQNQVEIGHWEIDHLCYRTSSQENYELSKKLFEGLGRCLIESEVNGRLIATYKLEKAIHYKNWVIDLVEVPAPKPNKETVEGFEHIEVVIDEPFSVLQEKYQHLQLGTKGMSKDLNPELEIEFDDCAIKFHHQSLEQVINIEKNELVMAFLNESQILSQLKEYSPTISGTLPLNIQTPQSDLDILFQTNDLESFEKKAHVLFQSYEGYQLTHSEHQGLRSSVINFNYQSLPVELFAQEKVVFKQQANQHYLIEARLLKLLGNDFIEKVKELKLQGMKTEPAFGEVLGLKEAYSELLELNKLSDSELLIRYS
ncbi:MAG: DUF4269 domain-containing protein [Oligoflexia bacterium]|nr:DUF4269 domain-containing protein [Oligoflexia bacterium]